MSAPPLEFLVARRFSRRALLGGLASLLGASRVARAASPPPSFAEVSRIVSKRLILPDGYEAHVVAAWGTPLVAAGGAPLPADAADQALRVGYNCDFLAFFTDEPHAAERTTAGLLCVNHETVDDRLMFPGVTEAGLTREQHRLQMAAVGHSVLDVAFSARGGWQVRPSSPRNRRLSALGPACLVSGPAAGHPRLATRADRKARKIVGTLANCAGGTTPWGTVLTAEENIEKFFRGTPETLGRDAETAASFGLSMTPAFAWWKADPRFDLTKEPAEFNRFGWIVEIDPRDPRIPPVKHSALGRFKHECATTVLAPSGQVVVFSADDQKFQYLYRWVSRDAYDPTRHHGAAARTLLTEGILSVAHLTESGSLEWRALVAGQGPLSVAAGFRDQGDVVIDARRAAALVGATPLDRPEDVVAHPDGRIFVMLTSNDERSEVAPGSPRPMNPYGHVLVITPVASSRGPDHAAAAATWDVLLYGDDPRLDAAQRSAAGLGGAPAASADGVVVCPDNGTLDPSGRLWLTSDGAEYRSGVADGIWMLDLSGPQDTATTRRFASVPTGAEATGPCFTPDGRTLFVSIQHPGAGSTWENPSTRFPDEDPKLPPRPAVVAIRRSDGGVVGG
ncbi:MAG: PhoX family phosphatase [Myxococcales bacterium]|nr:PhoX family phosphatase [Myxococcales bacterium]